MHIQSSWLTLRFSSTKPVTLLEFLNHKLLQSGTWLACWWIYLACNYFHRILWINNHKDSIKFRMIIVQIWILQPIFTVSIKMLTNTYTVLLFTGNLVSNYLNHIPIHIVAGCTSIAAVMSLLSLLGYFIFLFWQSCQMPVLDWHARKISPLMFTNC